MRKYRTGAFALRKGVISETGKFTYCIYMVFT
jgi:hypothetical protein